MTLATVAMTPANHSDIPVAAPYRLVRARHGTMLVNENDRFLGQAYLHYGECCELELRLLEQLSDLPGMTIEVGANMGIFTVPLALRLAQRGQAMMAFEPQPVIFQQLCANLALNGLTNVQAMPYACGAEESYVTFEVPEYGQMGNFGGVEMKLRGDLPTAQAMSASRNTLGRLCRVPCFRLDSFLPTEPVGMMKIDVEGFELAVLEGASQTIARERPLLLVENDRHEKSVALTAWLLGHGYRLWWHMTPLFNPDNLLGCTDDVYGEVVSLNMLCIPAEKALAASAMVTGLTEVSQPCTHPLMFG